uniref:Uncharacterized protein n=1 Tax=Arion vulgaris TaxID=1028688 RepID=A0A0B7B098_9EUPU
MDVWEFDAPQFVDFTQPQRFENEYNDTWFDTHTEDDDFLGLRKEADATQTKPKRALRNMATWNKQSDNEKVEVVDTGCKSPRYLNGKPARVLIGKACISNKREK